MNPSDRKALDKTLDICCALSKADIPEVEAMKRVLQTGLVDLLSQRGDRMVRDMLAKLEGFPDALGAPSVDELAKLAGSSERARQRRQDRLVAILASFYLIVTRIAGAALPGVDRQVVEGAASRLIQAGARRQGLVLSPERIHRLESAAVGHLETMALGIVPAARAEIEAIIERALTTRPLRHEQLPQTAESLRIATDAAEFVKALDTWAYTWFGIGGFEAAREAGFVAFQINAVLDERTTAFCVWVNGKLVPLDRAAAQVERQIDAALRGDYAKLISNWPFLNPKIATGGNEVQFEQFFRSVGLPPYHFGCRDVPEPIRL